MGLVGQALTGESPSPPASNIECTSSSSLELVQPRPATRRDRSTRPVATLKIARFWAALQRSGAVTAAAAAPQGGADGLDAFGSEKGPLIEARLRPLSVKTVKGIPFAINQTALLVGKWAAVVLLSAATAIFGVILYQRRVAQKPATGSLSVETTPAGLDVVIAGKTVGRTPVTLSLSPGAYDVQLGSGAGARAIKVNITAGTAVAQHVEMPATAETPVATTGALRIHTDPSKLPVFIDGVARGISPLTVDAIQPGDHEVTVRTDHGPLRRSVKIQPHETVSLIVSSTVAPVDASAAAGWLSITSSVPLQLRERGKVVGSTESDRLMLPAGDHDLELSNDSLGFKAQRKVHVNAGKVTATRIDLPSGTMNLNALPWAEVFVDGERIGETPIGNLSRPIGRHEVIFRHPDLGERRETIIVTVQGTARLGVDMRKR
jgi:hypothetical protein